MEECAEEADVTNAPTDIRTRITAEIISSEKSYLRDMELAMKWFHDPLKQRQLLPDHIIVAIFHHLPTIIEVSRELLQFLESGKESIASSFTKLAPYLKLYSGYAKNFDYAQEKLMEWMQKSKEFQTFKANQECRPELCGKKLNSLLITPVQRIPRYRLLLEDLLQHTPPTHPNYSPLKDAYTHISHVASHVNEHIKERENLKVMLRIQESLGGRSAPKIIQPGRVFIKEGLLNKMSKSGRGRRWEERVFFLFSDVLLYAKPKPFPGAGGGGPQVLYTCTCLLPLHHCQVERVLGHASSSHTHLQQGRGKGELGKGKSEQDKGKGEQGKGKSEQGALISIRCKSDHLLLWSKSVGEIDEWLEVIQDTITKLLNNRQTLRKFSSAKEPVHGARAVLKHTRSSIRKRKNEEPLQSVFEAIKEEDEGGEEEEEVPDALYPMRLELSVMKEAQEQAAEGPVEREGEPGGGKRRRWSQGDGGGRESQGLFQQIWGTLRSLVDTVESAVTDSMQRRRINRRRAASGPAGPHAPSTCSLM